MFEFMMFLTMIRADHGRPQPPKQPVAFTSQQTAGETRLSAIERQELRKAVEELARQSSGRLVRDENSGLYIPEGTALSATR